MQKTENTTYVLNDETKVNSYGFRIPNKGIDLARFESNPVVLDQHINSTSTVIGRWVNPRIKGSQLLANLEFDTDDELALKIKGKVERGFIKGVSIGISLNRDNMKLSPDGKYELVKCELFEASIVAIPSNANALKLYAESGELIPENEIKLSIQSLDTNNPEIKMSKIILSVAVLSALGLQNTENTDEVSRAVERLVSDLEAEKKARKELQTKVDEQLKVQVNALVDNAIKDGKLTASVKDKFVDMATNNYTLAAEVIGAMPSKASLSTNNPANPTEVKTADDFQKLSVEQQLAFKNNNPDAYAKLFA